MIDYLLTIDGKPKFQGKTVCLTIEEPVDSRELEALSNIVAELLYGDLYQIKIISKK